MIYVDRTSGQFWTRLASTIAVKCGHVEHLSSAFNETAFYCNDWGESFPKLFDCSIYAKSVCSTFYASPRRCTYYAPFCGRLCWYRGAETRRRRRLTWDTDSSRCMSHAGLRLSCPAISPTLCCSSPASDFCRFRKSEFKIKFCACMC